MSKKQQQQREFSMNINENMRICEFVPANEWDKTTILDQLTIRIHQL